MRSQAGNSLVEEVVLWPAGFKVVGRAANVRRVRMVWRQRRQQIGTESQLPCESGILYRLYDDGMIILSFALYRTTAAIMIIVTQKIKE
jgi:hypothetical protein